MSNLLPEINPDLAVWLESQPVFFVATAPLASTGHVNCSPKGGTCLKVLGPRRVVYQETTGSGVETIAHLRENGRIVLMFCAFQGDPKIVRLHGRGEVIRLGHHDFEGLHRLFPVRAGTRSYIQIDLTRVSDSCGFGVPLMTFQAPRDILEKWSNSRGPTGIAEYQRRKNARSIDGLPALDGDFAPPEPPVENSPEDPQ